MRFNAYRTVWEGGGAGWANRSHFGSYGEFYRWWASAGEPGNGDGYEEIVSNCEHAWLDRKKPYYKLWPAYAQMLLRTSLNLPVRMLYNPPHGAFGIYLPDGVSCLKFQSNVGDACELRSILVGFFLNDYDGNVSPRLMIVADSSLRKRQAFCFPATSGDTVIDEALETASFSRTWAKEAAMASLRLAVAVTLLAVSAHRCIEHDVLRRLRERYDAATSDVERESLAEKSRRRGVCGWNIGRGRCLSLTTAHSENDDDPTGRQLNYQHVRGGHFHTVRHGPGHSRTKVMFFEPTIVRPDLPVAPLENAS